MAQKLTTELLQLAEHLDAGPDFKYVKNYKTRENLLKGMADKELIRPGYRYLVVQNQEGRYTAVFILYRDNETDMLHHVINAGFKIVG